MAQVKFEKQEKLSRDEAAQWLREIAKALEHGEGFELERGGEKLELRVPKEVVLEFEIEIEDGETELEIEIKWPTAPRQHISASDYAPSEATIR